VTRYVDVGDAQVAYQVIGDGPPDLCYISGWGHLDLRWEVPTWAAFYEALASLGRLIIFDRRGTGMSGSDPDRAIPTWEDWTDDVRAVLDVAGSERAAILAEEDGGPVGLLFTAMQSERVTTLMLANTSARRLWAEDYQVGISQEAVDNLVQRAESTYGTPEWARMMYPSQEDVPEFFKRWAQLDRTATTPKKAAALLRYEFESCDARQALPLINAPTLVLHNQGNAVVPIAEGRWLADHIHDAKFVSLSGSSVWAAFSEGAVAEITEFLTGERPPVVVDRILTTVLFTDIVDSTRRAAAMGDHRWQELLAAHHTLVRKRLREFRGVEVDTAGDGFFATFDGPARAVRCAGAITEAVATLGLHIRAGLHTGEVELHEGKVSGLTVHIGARVGAAAQADEILVTRTVTELVVGSGMSFQDRGDHELKGVPGTWRLYAVAD
jgi:class 3 adenylate cyclase